MKETDNSYKLHIPFWKLVVKRNADLFISIILLLLLLPIIIIIAVLVKLTSKGPVLFIQERIGQYGHPFFIYKFRTMEAGAELRGKKFEITYDDPRLTRFGKWLRRMSFDEFPQLFNILRGDMSIIGPRPTLRYQVEQYAEEERRRLLVKPGVTGLAQVHGRNAISWAERIKWDLYYIDHYSLWLDLVIIVQTVKIWVTGEGLYSS